MAYDPLARLSFTDVFGATTASDTIQTGPGALYNLEVGNSDSIPYWVKCFDVAQGNFTLGVTTPFVNEYVPAASNLILNWAAHPKNFVNNCYLNITKNISGTDSIAPNASKVTINALYQ